MEKEISLTFIKVSEIPPNMRNIYKASETTKELRLYLPKLRIGDKYQIADFTDLPDLKERKHRIQSLTGTIRRLVKTELKDLNISCYERSGVVFVSREPMIPK